MGASPRHGAQSRTAARIRMLGGGLAGNEARRRTQVSTNCAESEGRRCGVQSGAHIGDGAAAVRRFAVDLRCAAADRLAGSSTGGDVESVQRRRISRGDRNKRDSSAPCAASCNRRLPKGVTRGTRDRARHGRGVGRAAGGAEAVDGGDGARSTCSAERIGGELTRDGGDSVGPSR